MRQISNKFQIKEFSWNWGESGLKFKNPDCEISEIVIFLNTEIFKNSENFGDFTIYFYLKKNR